MWTSVRMLASPGGGCRSSWTDGRVTILIVDGGASVVLLSTGADVAGKRSATFIAVFSNDGSTVLESGSKVVIILS